MDVLYGPMQLFMFGFDQKPQEGVVSKAFKKAVDSGAVRLIDVMYVAKDAKGNIDTKEYSDLSSSEKIELGAVVGGLMGFGMAGEEGMELGEIIGALEVAENDGGMAADELKDLADNIPNDSAAAVILVEHLWAKEVKAALLEQGGFMISQTMITPETLIESGADVANFLEAAADDHIDA